MPNQPAEDPEASATALGPLVKMAAEVASITGVSYREAFGSLLAASELLAKAWDQGVRAANDARPGGLHRATLTNPYRSADA